MESDKSNKSVATERMVVASNAFTSVLTSTAGKVTANLYSDGRHLTNEQLKIALHCIRISNSKEFWQNITKKHNS